MSSKTFNVSVIGYGLSAKVFHIPFIQLTPGLNLHSIVQRGPKPGSSAPETFPSLKHFTSVDAMLQDPDVDLVVVTTPPDSHFDLTKRILHGGKHALVEKPFVPTSAEAEELAQLARDRGRLICVYQNRRWDADFATVQRLLDEGALGRVYEFETHFDRFKPAKPTNWKAVLTHADGFGAIYDLGAHLIDQVYVLFGKPTAAYAKLVQQRSGNFVSGDGGPEDQADSANVVLTYVDRGLLVHVRIGVMSVESQQPRFWIRGTRGTYRKNGLDPQEPQLISGKKVTDEGFGVEDAAWDGRLDLLQDDGSVKSVTCPNDAPKTYLKLYDLLAGALATGKQEDAPVPAAQAADVLKIIEAILESARSGMEVKVA